MSKPAEVIKSFARRGEEGYSQTEALMAALELVSINAELLDALKDASKFAYNRISGFGVREGNKAVRVYNKARAAIQKAEGE